MKCKLRTLLNRLDITSSLLPTTQIDLITTSEYGAQRHFRILTYASFADLALIAILQDIKVRQQSACLTGDKFLPKAYHSIKRTSSVS